MSSARRLSNLQPPLTAVPAGIPLMSSELFNLLGWESLSERVKQAIQPDLADYSTSILESRPIVAAQEQRRRRILYWIECLQMGLCSEQTVLDALAD